MQASAVSVALGFLAGATFVVVATPAEATPGGCASDYFDPVGFSSTIQVQNCSDLSASLDGSPVGPVHTAATSYNSLASVDGVDLFLPNIAPSHFGPATFTVQNASSSGSTDIDITFRQGASLTSSAIATSFNGGSVSRFPFQVQNTGSSPASITATFSSGFTTTVGSNGSLDVSASFQFFDSTGGGVPTLIAIETGLVSHSSAGDSQFGFFSGATTCAAGSCATALSTVVATRTLAPNSSMTGIVIMNVGASGQGVASYDAFNTHSLVLSGSSPDVVFAAVPEPSVPILMGLAVGLAAVGRARSGSRGGGDGPLCPAPSAASPPPWPQTSRATRGS